jgi:hypothetical protein
LLGGGAACLLVFFLPRVLNFQKDAQLFLPFTLVSIHAPQILETRTDVVSPGAHNSGWPDPLFYEELGKAYRTAQAQNDRYRTLGFYTDYIQYQSGFFATIMQKEGWNDREIAAACYSAYFRAWRQNPLSMVRKIWKQMPLFLFPRAGDFYSTTRSIDLNHEIAASRPFLPEDRLSPAVKKIYQSYLQRLEIPASGPSHPLGFPILSKLAFYLARISFWLQLAFFAALAAICLSGHGRAWRLAGLTTVAVLAATYGNVLTIAVVHSLDVIRYRVSYAPGFLLGLLMITNYLPILALGKLGKRGESSIEAKENFERTSGS